MASPGPYVRAVLARFVIVKAHEIPTLLYASSSFFFILSAYFMVIPFRDEAALSLGVNILPLLFFASLVVTLIAAPISSHFLSLPFLSKSRALLIMYRFFGVSLALFFIFYTLEAAFSWDGDLSAVLLRLNINRKESDRVNSASLQACFYIWIALLNLLTTSALWARLADVMDSEEGARLFGFVGAGATLGQLVGSILAGILASYGPFLLLLSAVFMELAGRCASGIGQDNPSCWISNACTIDGTRELDKESGDGGQVVCGKSQWPSEFICSKLSSMLEGCHLILSSSYLLHICCFLWLTAVVSSLFYFQRATVVASITKDPLGRRQLLAEINSLIAVFILIGQLTITGRVMTFAGVSVALSASPIMAVSNMIAIYFSPTSLVLALSEACRKFMTYVMTKPGREVLFTVVSREEKYKAKIFIDTFIQRLGDAAAAGIYEIVGRLFLMEPSTVALFSIPVCFGWLFAALTLGHRQQALAKSLPENVEFY